MMPHEVCLTIIGLRAVCTKAVEYKPTQLSDGGQGLGLCHASSPEGGPHTRLAPCKRLLQFCLADWTHSTFCMP